MKQFTHIDKKGSAQMVNITDKKPSLRTAIAKAVIFMNNETFDNIFNKTIKKGNVLETAKIAGIMSAKKTWDVIPMCHPLNITHVKIDFYPDKKSISIKVEATVSVFDKTGVEMEALTAASVATLTIYDMCKSYDKSMIISDICLLKKSGGKSGTFLREKI